MNLIYNSSTYFPNQCRAIASMQIPQCSCTYSFNDNPVFAESKVKSFKTWNTIYNASRGNTCRASTLPPLGHDMFNDPVDSWWVYVMLCFVWKSSIIFTQSHQVTFVVLWVNHPSLYMVAGNFKVLIEASEWEIQPPAIDTSFTHQRWEQFGRWLIYFSRDKFSATEPKIIWNLPSLYW